MKLTQVVVGQIQVYSTCLSARELGTPRVCWDPLVHLFCKRGEVCTPAAGMPEEMHLSEGSGCRELSYVACTKGLWPIWVILESIHRSERFSFVEFSAMGFSIVQNPLLGSRIVLCLRRHTILGAECWGFSGPLSLCFVGLKPRLSN
jgi:hypothetical protein